MICVSSCSVTLVTTTLSRLIKGLSCPDCCLEVSSSCVITNVAKIVVKRYLQKEWCEPASGKNNGLSDRCESVGVLLTDNEKIKLFRHQPTMLDWYEKVAYVTDRVTDFLQSAQTANSYPAGTTNQETKEDGA